MNDLIKLERGKAREIRKPSKVEEIKARMLKLDATKL